MQHIHKTCDIYSRGQRVSINVDNIITEIVDKTVDFVRLCSLKPRSRLDLGAKMIDPKKDFVSHFHASDRLEKMLEIKVMMNWLKRNIDITPKRAKDWHIELTNLQEYFPIFCHCNKDLIEICITMLISHASNESFNLITYDELYQEFVSNDN